MTFNEKTRKPWLLWSAAILVICLALIWLRYALVLDMTGISRFSPAYWFLVPGALSGLPVIEPCDDPSWSYDSGGLDNIPENRHPHPGKESYTLIYPSRSSLEDLLPPYKQAATDLGCSVPEELLTANKASFTFPCQGKNFRSFTLNRTKGPDCTMVSITLVEE